MKKTIEEVAEEQRIRIADAGEEYRKQFDNLPAVRFNAFCAGAKYQSEQTCNHIYILISEQGHRVIKCTKCNNIQPI